MRPRIVPTASGKKAVQVVSKRAGKVAVHKHIGTFATDSEKALLLKKAEEFIAQSTGQSSLLDLLSSIKLSEIAITLEARPIFHRLDETIKAHLVIVFAGLAMCKYIELRTNMSIRKVLKLAEKILTHKVINPKTGETAYIETTIEDSALREKLNLLKSLGH